MGMAVLVGSDSLLIGNGDLLDKLRAARALGLLCDERRLEALGATATRWQSLVPLLEVRSRCPIVPSGRNSS